MQLCGGSSWESCRPMLPQTIVWRPLADSRAGYLYNLSESLRILEGKNPGLLVATNQHAMIIASDYSGQHKDASHEAYSFVVTSDKIIGEWLPRLGQFRKLWLPDGRRLSFKNLNEPVRWRALPSFLETIGHLAGNMITIMVDRRVGSFISGGPKAIIESFPDCFSPNIKHGTVEKMFRLASFVALILSGLRHENQESHWISDHDEALDSHEKREKFGLLARHITYGCTDWKQPANMFFGTTELSYAPAWAEDIAAIPDIMAGAYCKISRHIPAILGEESWKVAISSGNIRDQRAFVVGSWLTRCQTDLKHVLLRLERDAFGEVRASAQAFVGHS